MGSGYSYKFNKVSILYAVYKVCWTLKRSEVCYSFSNSLAGLSKRKHSFLLVSVNIKEASA